MNAASVGFQCPRCVAVGRPSVRQAADPVRCRDAPGGGIATKVVMGVLVGGLGARPAHARPGDRAAGHEQRLVGRASSGGSSRRVHLRPAARGADEPARAVAGRAGDGVRAGQLAIPAALPGVRSRRRDAVLPRRSAGVRPVGASSAIVGLLAANAIGKAKTGEDIRPDIGLLVLLVAYAVLVGFTSFGWVTLIGGIAVGALAERSWRTHRGRTGWRSSWSGMLASSRSAWPPWWPRSPCSCSVPNPRHLVRSTLRDRHRLVRGRTHHRQQHHRGHHRPTQHG